MSQKKKLLALNKLLSEITEAIKHVNEYEQENLFLDKIVKEFNQAHPLPNLKAIIEDKHSEEGMQPDEYYYYSDFGKNAPSTYALRSARQMSEKKQEKYNQTLQSNKNFIIESISKFEQFLLDNYTVELSSSKKKIVESFSGTKRHFFVKQCKYPICVYITLSNPSISFSLINDLYDSDLVKEFKKSFLVSFYEKKVIESSMKDLDTESTIKRKTQKI
jgi:hypothetical protein